MLAKVILLVVIFCPVELDGRPNFGDGGFPSAGFLFGLGFQNGLMLILIMIAVKGGGAGVVRSESTVEPIRVSEVRDPAAARFCESVESGHSDQDWSVQIARKLGITTEPVRMDSQCKYAAVARGDASIYLRLPTRAGYEEKIWDHAAGMLVVEEAGGVVSDIDGKPLDFGHGRTLRHNRGVVATCGPIHAAVIDAISATEG